MKTTIPILFIFLVYLGACNEAERPEFTVLKETTSGSGLQSESETPSDSVPSTSLPTALPTTGETLPTVDGLNPTPVPTEAVNISSCSVSITSPSTDILAFNQSISGSLVINGTGGSIGQPKLVFDQSFNIPISSSGFHTWSFSDFNPFRVNTRLEVGVPTQKTVKATYTDTNGVERACEVSIRLAPNDSTVGSDSSACRFLSTSNFQPLLSQIRVTTSDGPEFNWSQIFVLETSDTSKKPVVKFTFNVAPFTFTPNPSSIILRADGAGWNINVIGRNNVLTKIDVDSDSPSKSCSITADPDLP